MAYVEQGLQHIYFVGAQMQPDLARLCSIANVGVFPSKAEPFGMVFIECMACLCPVIGANSGGPKDFVSDAVGALVPEPGGYEKAHNEALAKDLDATITKAIDE